MLPFNEAYDKDICQICEKQALDTMEYVPYSLFVHRTCHMNFLNKSKTILAVEQARAKQVCQVCRKPANEHMTYHGDVYFMHTTCYNHVMEAYVNNIPVEEKHAHFESGATRSTDTKDVDFWLITPIGLEAVANCYISRNYSFKNNIDLLNLCKDHLNKYLSGKRDLPYLALATADLFDLVHYDKFKEIFSAPEIVNYNPNFCQIPPFALRELARTYNEGKLKYSEYNCELGFPVHDLINHALNHINLYELGDTSERHLSHGSWNTIMAIHSKTMTPEVSVGFLRGEGCTLTPEIRKRIDDAKRKKS